MSSIFSDPPFRRGATLLSGEVIELDANSAPIAGRDVVGTVKAFQDALPTGLGTRLSSRLVYCTAVRYTGSSDLDPATIAGRVIAFSDTAPMTEWTGGFAVPADIAAGKPCGVIDEYLALTVRKNDILWVVIKGPTTVVKNDATAVAAGQTVEVVASSSGRVVALSTGTAVAQSLAGVSVTGAQGTTLRVNKICNFAFA